ncbi:tetratricopeptide repeat-containing sensor histidine kinase [Chondrinema litorale]|uniref:tetratricopeptide repeat-containing sensor histidine kinase n=1 Tax=Chondrinema litorale TaxID=2994555 RepID=UPI0025431F33|nr:tetratricopeptide repeat protein [Chondrinema litorale]UZR94923.1 tetratricopeptide repeat protein [Chondrinema litorale]
MNRPNTIVLVVVFCALFFGNYKRIQAQDNIDSLKNVIANHPDDTSKIGLYHDLIKLLLKANKQSDMLKMAEEGLALSQKLEYPHGIIKMTLSNALALDISGNPDKAIALYNKGLKLAKKENDKALEARFYLDMGVSYYFAGDLDLSLKHYLLAYDLSEHLGKSYLSRLLNNIGVVYRIQEKYDRAVEIYAKSYELKQGLKDSLGMATSLMNIGLVYYRMEEKQDKAIDYIEQSKQLYRELNRPDEVASCNTSLAVVYLDQDNIPKAKEELKKAWAFYEENVSEEYSAATLSQLADIATKENDYVLAEDYLVKALELVTRFGQKKNQKEILYALGDIKNHLGKEEEAYSFLKRAYALNDTLNESARLEAMEEMQAKFDVKEKENELEISELKLSERTLERDIFLLGAAAFAIFAFTMFFFLRNRIRSNKKIALQTEKIQSQTIIELQQQNKLLALNSMIEGQEAERLRIAKDLHDSLGGLLSTVKAHFTSIRDEVKELETLTITEKTNDLIDVACVEVRRISHNMIPHALSISGLPSALEDIAESLVTEGYKVDLDILDFPDNINVTKQAMIYRLVQEAISNIRKYALAKTIFIQLFNTGKGLGLIIEDDGIGFDYEKAIASGGLGLQSINSRVEFLDGEIDWDTSPERGTTITITIANL